MRLLVEMELRDVTVPLTQPDKHVLQEWWYSLLEGTEYEVVKNRKGFKFFCFSDVFPLSRVVEGGLVKVVLSSPWEKLVRAMDERLELDTTYSLERWGRVTVRGKKVFHLTAVGTTWITGSPVVVRGQRKEGEPPYVTIAESDPSRISFYLRRLAENAIKKFQAFHGVKPNVSPPLFTELEHGKTVRVPVSFPDGTTHVVVGTTWRRLRLPRIRNRRVKEFYQFLMDVGLGERNSLGFGFVNPVKNEQ